MNTLYYGDNLHVLREHIPTESVDLIYLDPPFNSKKNYNVLYKNPQGKQSDAQITAFEDTWHWSTEHGSQAEREYAEILHQPNTDVAELITALRKALGDNDLMAYLVMMTNRLLELHRVLKPTGSLYLHCDPTASHYLKVVMDRVFGENNFQNEIIWHYRKWSAGKYTFQKNHDVIFFYSKTDTRERPFTQLFMPRAESTLKRFGKAKIVSGYNEDGTRIPSQEQGESEGARMDDVWDIGRVPPIKQLFPTQKPEVLLERIITASCPEDGIVLDPFSGCGTAVVTAQRLGRQWIGIDITHLAIALIEKRMRDAFPGIVFEVKGTPKDLDGSCDLARRDKYQFQWWACSLVNAQPYQGKKKGADSGIDGLIFFQDDASGAKKIVVSVKGGDSITRTMIADLKNSVEREGAKIGLFVTLVDPTGPMRDEAASAGFYESSTNNLRFPKIQILTISGLLSGNQRPEYFDLSRGTLTFQQTTTAKPAQKQTELKL